MRVSVIIPTYNSGHLVVDAIASALAQTRAPAEVVVVDDGSADDTRERLATFGPPVRYVYQENAGVAAARNRGLSKSHSELIAFLDADDVWHPRKLECQVRALDDNPDLGLVGTAAIDWPAESFPAMEHLPAPPLTRVRWNDFVVRNPFVTSSVVVRRQILERVGEFDTALQGPEDFDLWLRVAREAEVANLPLPLTGYRDVAGSLGKQAVTMEAGTRRILEKLAAGGAFRGKPFLRRKAWSYLYFSCGYMHGAAGNPTRALRMMLKSFLTYPIPYRSHEVRVPLARVRLFARTAVRAVAHWRTNTNNGDFARPSVSRKGLVNP